MMPREVVLDYFNVLHVILGGGIEENHKIFQSVFSVHGLDPIRVPHILFRGVAL